MSSREQFEAWAEKSGFITSKVFVALDDSDDVENTVYTDGQTRSAWKIWQASLQPAPDFHRWLEDAKPLVGYESHIADGNFDHADVIRLMELAYNSGAGRV